MHILLLYAHTSARCSDAGCDAAYSINLISRYFREHNDEVYYVPRSRAARRNFRGVIYAHIYTYGAYMSRRGDIFVLMQLLFGNKTFVKPDVQRINHMTRNVFLGERPLFRSATRPIIRRQVSRFCLAISYTRNISREKHGRCIRFSLSLVLFSFPFRTSLRTCHVIFYINTILR